MVECFKSVACVKVDFDVHPPALTLLGVGRWRSQLLTLFVEGMWLYRKCCSVVTSNSAVV